MSEWIDEQDEFEKLVDLHLAKIIEELEWENTLSKEDKHSRRLRRYLGETLEVVRLSAESGHHVMFLGHMERIYYHMGEVFGKDWMERAAKERKAIVDDWIGPDDEDAL